MITKPIGRTMPPEDVSNPVPVSVEPVPVTLLTGFLGSGKTTLLNNVLTDSGMCDVAVVVNEFGSVSVDHDLIHAGREEYVITSTGCLCCTATSDIRASLHELYDARSKGNLPDFRHVIVETTGLADPAPIINSLIPGGAPATTRRDHTVARCFRLAGVVTTFDVQNGETAFGEHFECWKQLAFADQIVLTKTDLVSEAGWINRLREANPHAFIHDSNAPGFDPALLFEPRLFSTADKPEDVLGWLAMEQFSDSGGYAHEHDPDRHGAGIAALPLTHDEPLDPRTVDSFLKILTSQHNAGLLRLKGIFALSDDPSKPAVTHAVQHMLYPTVRLDRWPSNDMRSRVMIIGKNLPFGPIGDLFNSLTPRKRRWWFSRR